MSISIDAATFVISVPKADLTLVTGTLFEHDTEAFRLELIDFEDSEQGIVAPRTHLHNTEVTIAGVTYARFIEMIAPYSVEYEDGAYSVRLAGSNNNIFDVENGILVQNLVQIISQNSAGLQVVVSGSGVTQQDKDDIEAQIFAHLMENGETFADQTRLNRANAAGSIRKSGDVHRVRDAADSKDRITATADETDRDVTATDGT